MDSGKNPKKLDSPHPSRVSVGVQTRNRMFLLDLDISMVKSDLPHHNTKVDIPNNIGYIKKFSHIGNII